MQKEKWTKLFVCFVVIVVASAAATKASTPHGLSISPTAGCAPLAVRLAGTVHPPTSGVYVARIYWGDGDFYEYWVWWGSGHFDINVVHTYKFLGQYTVVRTLQWTDETEPSFVDSSTVITVLPDSFTIDSEADPQSAPETGCMRFRVMSNDIVPSRVSEAWVSWGDGAAEPFTWEKTDSGYVTPYHDYREAGIYQVTLRHLYDNACEMWARTGIVTGCSTPVEKTTWGRVKSLYQ